MKSIGKTTQTKEHPRGNKEKAVTFSTNHDRNNKKNAELPKIRISSELFVKMNKCLESIREQAEIEISMSAFRRMCYKDFTEKVLSEGLEISFTPE